MAHVLYIEASPRKMRSASIEVAKLALAAWREADPDVIVDKLDVWSTELPNFDGVVMEAKYAGICGTPLTPEQESAWAAIRTLAERFHAADAIVLAVPLWNLNVPYKFKHLIDVVSQKDLLFSFDERGLSGLLRGRVALLICARGHDYSANGLTPAERYDFQRPYIEAWLRFIGVDQIRTVVVEKTLDGPEIDRAARESAKVEAVAAARRCADYARHSASLHH